MGREVSIANGQLIPRWTGIAKRVLPSDSFHHPVTGGIAAGRDARVAGGGVYPCKRHVALSSSDNGPLAFNCNGKRKLLNILTTRAALHTSYVATSTFLNSPRTCLAARPL
eukprot:scaffold130178_cov28-Tisochrysis_lutea.AAC.1